MNSGARVVTADERIIHSGPITGSSRVSIQSAFSLTKPAVTLMNLFMTLCGILLAGVPADPLRAFALLLGSGLAIGSAGTMNMYLERSADARMNRTNDRPLPAGRISVQTALWLGIIEGIVSVVILGGFVSILAVLVAATAWIVYVCFYTPLKYHTPAALWAGLVAGAIPPVLGYAGMNGRLDAGALTIFLLLYCWQVPHVLAIDFYRREDYARAGVKLYDIRTTFIGIALGLLSVATAVWLPVFYLPTGPLYRNLVAAFCVIPTVYAWQTYRNLEAADEGGFARKVFIMSLFFLPGLFVLLVVDRFFH